MRALLLLLALFLAPALPAAGWDQVALFDWVYPGEAAYTALKQGAVQAQTQHWSVERLRRGEKIPQASARELARILLADPKVDGATKLDLEKLLASEGAQLGLGSDSGALGRAESLAAHLDKAAQRIDEIESIYKKNLYGKGSTPAINMDLYSAYRSDVPGGFLQRRNRAFIVGGALFTLNATIDKANVALGLGTRYWAGDSTRDLGSDLEGQYSVGASFQLPLDNGGLEVHMGDKVQVFLSPLLLGNLFQEGREPFAVDVINAYRPTRVVKLLDLEYPAFTREYHALTVTRQGQAWYWPFSRTQFLYTPADNDYWETWNAKIYTMAGRVDREIHPNSWMDPGLYYVVAQRSFQDKDAIRGAGVGGLLAQSAESYGAGLELRLVAGTQLKVEGAVSNYVTELTIGGPQRVDSDMAAIGTLVQPVGPFNLAFEGGIAGPRFLTGPRVGNRLQTGATLDSLASIPWPTGDPYALTWVSFMKDPAIMTNNSTRMSLKGEWRNSWLGVGLYGGVINQINPSDGRVVINPVIQGREDNGYGWFRLFGQTYAPPPAPLATSGPTPGEAAQAQFNVQTDGLAFYSPTGSQNIHWQEISQQGYREAYFSLWLSETGVGDRRLMAPVTKVFNYVGSRATLDFGAVFERLLPSQLILMGELRDLALTPGLPSLDASNLFSQNFIQATYEHGLTEIFTLVGKAAFETWKSQRSFYPVDMQTLEWAGGFDLRLDPYVTGLQANLRGSSMQFEDLNRPGRAFSLWTLSLGTTLSY